LPALQALKETQVFKVPKAIPEQLALWGHRGQPELLALKVQRVIQALLDPKVQLGHKVPSGPSALKVQKAIRAQLGHRVLRVHRDRKARQPRARSHNSHGAMG
jgi:hypothetical protein